MSLMARAGWLVIVAVGCGGSVFTEGDGGTPTDGGKPAHDGGGGPVCPPSPATPKSACSPVNLECEYGSDPNPNCNTLMTCTTSGWVNSSTGTLCPGPGPMCPATYASV